jgi:hypothetical protein
LNADEAEKARIKADLNPFHHRDTENTKKIMKYINQQKDERPEENQNLKNL